MQKTLSSELEWIRSTPSTRNKKNKSRVSDYEKLASNKVEMQENLREIQIAPAPYLGDIAIKFENVSKGIGGQSLIEKPEL